MAVTSTNGKRFNPLSLDAVAFLLADVCGALDPHLDGKATPSHRRELYARESDDGSLRATLAAKYPATKLSAMLAAN